jgi:hypothetical protein
MKKKLFFLFSLTCSVYVNAQNVGINTANPQTTLDVKGNYRIGGNLQYMSFDSLSGKMGWTNTYLFVPVTQALMKHSAAADGLFYNNSGGINGQLEYRNEFGNPVFFTNFTNGNGYFKSKLGIATINPLAGLHVADSAVLFTAPASLPSSPAPLPLSGAGNRLLWYPQKASFRTGGTSGTSWDKDSIGIYSFASGFDSKATGTYATATGYGTKAVQGYSTAMGFFAAASGAASAAIGNQTTAKAFGAVSLGSLNDFTDNPDPLNISPEDRIFQIGNGFGFFPGNAMTVLRNGNVGIGILTPFTRLHVHDNSVLFSASGNVPVTSAPPPVQGEGRRMMWYADKAAFRVGYIGGSQWDQSNIGFFSFAAGINTNASGASSVAMGNSTIASGDQSTAMGFFTNASHYYSTAMGYLTQASELASIATGYSTIASGYTSTAMGKSTIASGSFSTAMGQLTTASGYTSTAMGFFTNAKSGYETVLGAWNTDYTPLSTTWNPLDRLFVIGNGTGPGATSNAMTILKNGNIGHWHEYPI